MQQQTHNRIARYGDAAHAVAAEFAEQDVDVGDGGGLQLPHSLRGARMVDPGHDIVAEPVLAVEAAGARDDFAVPDFHRRDRRGAEIDADHGFGADRQRRCAPFDRALRVAAREREFRDFDLARLSRQRCPACVDRHRLTGDIDRLSVDQPGTGGQQHPASAAGPFAAAAQVERETGGGEKGGQAALPAAADRHLHQQAIRESTSFTAPFASSL